MFLALIFQYLNKLVECEIGDFTSPKAFHSVYVQRFKGNGIKAFAQVRGKLPVKVFALTTDFPIQTCELPDSTPPVIRTFLFSRKTLIEGTELFQRLFQKFWRLYLLTCGKCQVSVFHAKVCPYAFTCSWQWSEICVGCCNTKPIVTAVITFDCDTCYFPVPLAMFVKGVRHFIKLPFACFRIPLTQRQCDTIILQIPACFSRKGDRLELMPFLDTRSASKFVEKTLICLMNTFQLTLYRLARQDIPMWVCRPFQQCKVGRHSMIVRIRQPVFIPLTLPLMKILVNLPHIIKQITNAYCVRLFPQRSSIYRSSWSIKYQVFNPCIVGGQTRYQEVTLYMSANLIL